MTVSAQSGLATRDSVYIFWQPENRLVLGDYKCSPAYGGVHAEVALWSVLDLPVGTERLSPKQMKVAIAPVCHQRLSYADTADADRLAYGNVLFDILEVSARKARMKLSQLPDSVMSTAALSETVKTIVREMHEDRLRTNRKFHKEMFRDKKKDALTNWQQKLKQDLDSTAEWATRPIDCYRFLQNHPLEEGYTEDLNSNAVVLSDHYEKVLGRDTWHAEFCQISRLRK